MEILNIQLSCIANLGLVHKIDEAQRRPFLKLEDVDDGDQNFGHGFPPHHLSFMSCMVSEIRGFTRHVLFQGHELDQAQSKIEICNYL